METPAGSAITSQSATAVRTKCGRSVHPHNLASASDMAHEQNLPADALRCRWGEEVATIAD